MSDTVPSYPLQWPEGRPRTPPHKRQSSRFRTALPTAIENVKKSLRGFQADAGRKIGDVILSSDANLMVDDPRDPGAAVWFKLDGDWVCFAVDLFPSLAANVQAIHHIIEARRVEVRFGGFNFVKQSFKSFLALPSPGADNRPWWDVLGIPSHAGKDAIEAAYRDKAKAAHPDAGGSAEAFSRLSRAKKEALEALS